MYTQKLGNTSMRLISTEKIKSNLSMKLVYIWYPTDVPVIKLNKQYVIEISTEIANVKLVNIVSNLYKFSIELISHWKIEKSTCGWDFNQIRQPKQVNVVFNWYPTDIPLENEKNKM